MKLFQTVKISDLGGKRSTSGASKLGLEVLDFIDFHVSYITMLCRKENQHRNFPDTSENLFFDRTSQTVSHVAHVAKSVFRNGPRGIF